MLKIKINILIAVFAIGSFALLASQNYELGMRARAAVMTLYPQSIKQRLWAHHVDSLQTLGEAENLYYGLELDVLYHSDSNIFDVNHPSTPSIGVSLDDYFSQLQKPISLRFWMDYKNLHSSNIKASLSRLKLLCEKHQIKPQHIIIESSEPLLTLAFKNEGFYTSYYLPSKTLNILVQSPESKAQELEELKILYSQSQVDAVSTSIEFYPYVRKHFPTDTKILLWDTSLHAYRPVDFFRTWRKMKSFENVEVLLTSFSSRYNN